ncbi:MAG: FCD domain-containing protein [Actinomycetota bacterium]|nr:FCD domain-containing protein [Actinomycetota bacterium]
MDTGAAAAVGRDLRRVIDEQVLAPAATQGGRLPAERNIAEQLGCSRTRVRHILAELEREGRITRAVGRGTFLTSSTTGSGTTNGFGTTFAPSAIMTASMVFEPEVVAMAALAATEEDFAELRRCLSRCESATDYESFEQWDISLHRAFALATHNRQIVAMVDVLNSTRNNPVWGRLKEDGFTPANRATIEHDHSAIVTALVDRDRRRAARAMTDHLRFVRRMVAGQ